MEQLDQPLSRRRLLQLTAGGVSAVALARALAVADGAHAALGSSAAQRASTLKMWWWGQQEAVGIQRWMTDTLKKFQQRNGVKVAATLMDTSNVIPQFTNAAAAGHPPDVQFLFNGIYHMENVWLGYVNELNGLLPASVLKSSGATKLSVYKGKQYRVGFYAVGFGIAYNKSHFRKAGLDPNNPPKTWAQFLTACKKLKAKGYIPIGGGVKDGFLGEWYLVNALTQNLDTPADALNLFIGKLDWHNPRYYEHWSRLEELKKKGYFNNDINSLQLYQGIQLFDTGKASMCFNTTPAIPNSQKQLGAKNVGYFVMPRVRPREDGRHPDNRHAGLRYPNEGERSRDGGEAPRLHALEGACAGNVDAVEAGACEHDVQRRRNRRPARAHGAAQVGSRKAQRLHRRPHADEVLDRCHVRRIAEDPRRQHDRQAGG